MRRPFLERASAGGLGLSDIQIVFFCATKSPRQLPGALICSAVDRAPVRLDVKPVGFAFAAALLALPVAVALRTLAVAPFGALLAAYFHTRL